MGPESLCEARTKSNSLFQMSLISSDTAVSFPAFLMSRPVVSPGALKPSVGDGI